MLFGRLLADHARTKRKDASLRDIAGEVGCGSAMMTRMAHGERRPPVKYLEPLADALRLSGKERAEFIRSGLQAFLGEDFTTVAGLFGI